MSHSLGDRLDARGTMSVGDRAYRFFRLDALRSLPGSDLDRLPIPLKILLENLLRHEDGETVTAEDIANLAGWPSNPNRGGEIAYFPVRVLMPDSSGIPLMADLTAMRDAMRRMGGDPRAVNPVIPVDMVVDHSVTAEFSGSPDAYDRNLELEYRQNHERYSFLKWCAEHYDRYRVLPPGHGILHQINLEHLTRPIWSAPIGNETYAFPDTLVGMDSHTPMINAAGVLGWGVGGIEAGSAMLGQPISLAIPEVVGCHLYGKRRPGVTSTDLVLAITQALRAMRVVGKLVDFTGPGAAALSLTDRATIANMAPEYGATMGFFAIDEETLRYLRMTGRSEADVALAEAYAKAQGMWGGEARDTVYNDRISIDLGAVEPAMAGPRRPQDRHRLSAVPASFRDAFPARPASPAPHGERAMRDGDVIIASITSCTNTSNPSVLMAAGLLARNAAARGLRPKPWVKTSLSPGSRVVADYLEAAGLRAPLDALGFHIVGYGCMTCAGGSGSVAPAVEEAVAAEDLVVSVVLSSNRNFEGRIHPLAKAAYIGSPPLVIAYALAGSVLTDLEADPLGHDRSGQPVHLRDLWPDDAEIENLVRQHVTPDLFRRRYGTGFEPDRFWQAMSGQSDEVFHWDPASDYLVRNPFFDDLPENPRDASDITGARALLILGDSVNTDHISPAGAIWSSSAAATYLRSRGVGPKDFHSFLSRRGNHHVMMRGAWANRLLRNEMLPDMEGGHARHIPSGEVMSVFDAAARYRSEDVPVIVVAGAEYGSGSSRDWAAKGANLLGVRAVLAESFERIHRSNLVGMGVLPLQFPDGVTRRTLGLDGSERFDILGLAPRITPKSQATLRITKSDGSSQGVTVLCRLDTAREIDWYLNGGVLQYVFRNLLRSTIH
ncbi:aconitate hydratase AcnA [Muricoccus radiodurans]|uniref:aconitate hydratase AcnA n=1 Tax=Muricoccus radiodurans TaxID=2231721 RepID=UPI003CF8FD62